MIDTETKIKESTIELLLKDGKFGVSMQEIAEKSKISRSVIHYYFRSKEILLSVVDDEIVKKLLIPRYQKLFGDEPLDLKIDLFLAESEKNFQMFPYIDVYSISEFSNSDIIKNYILSLKPFITMLLDEIKIAIDNKSIRYSDPLQFLMDLFSLSSYSHICFNFLRSNENILDWKVKEFSALERREVVKKILLN